MKITDTLLLEKGFEKKFSKDGFFYVKGKIGVVYNGMWLPCNVDTGVPINTCIRVDSIEDLYKLAKEAGESI